MTDNIQLPWKNRIVGHSEKPAKDFLANPYNFRIHTSLQDSAVLGALDSIGWVKEVIENIQTGHLIDGHERVTLAYRKAETTPVPCTQVDLTPQEELIVLAMLDAMAAMAGTDKDKLGELLSGIQTDNNQLQSFFESMAQEHNLIPPEEKLLPSEFGEFDESLDFEYCCPKCGYQWSGKPR
jgi:hypothetical protein